LGSTDEICHSERSEESVFPEMRSARLVIENTEIPRFTRDDNVLIKTLLRLQIIFNPDTVTLPDAAAT